MKLTIIAATGGVGRQLLRQASDAGHDVTAVARNPASLPQDVLAGRAARIVAADLAAPDPRSCRTQSPGPTRCCPPSARTTTPTPASPHPAPTPSPTLYQWRYLGIGPKAGRVGRHLRYDPEDVKAWFRSQQGAA